MNYLILDIETVPREHLPEPLEIEIQRRVQLRLEKTVDNQEDLESLIRSTSPFFGRVLCIGLRWYNDDQQNTRDKVICEATEEETLNRFFQIINHENTRLVKFVHYNGLGFDIPFLIIRAAHYDIPITNKRFRNLRRFSFESHIDLMMFLANWNTYQAVSLEVACQSFGIPSPKEGEVTGESVADAFRAGNIQAVEDYVMRDVEATFQLFRKLKPYF